MDTPTVQLLTSLRDLSEHFGHADPSLIGSFTGKLSREREESTNHPGGWQQAML